MSYKVGQVIYLIHPQKLAVVPVQVVEQIIKRTVSGEEIVYNLQPPQDAPQVTLSSFDGEVFENLGSVKEYLLTNMRQHVDTMIEKTAETVQSNFEVSEQPLSRRRGRPKKNEDPGAVQVDLGDGQMGNLKISEDLQQLVK